MFVCVFILFCLVFLFVILLFKLVLFILYDLLLYIFFLLVCGCVLNNDVDRDVKSKEVRVFFYLCLLDFYVINEYVGKFKDN